MRQKDLARRLGLSPQSLNEILASRNRPTGSQILAIQAFLRDQTIMTHPVEPKTLLAAKEQIASLTSELNTLRAGSATAPSGAASITPRQPAPKLTSSDSSTYSTDGPLTLGRPAVAMPVNYPAVEKKLLPASANTPYLIGEILKVMSLEDLLSMLDNPAHSQTQQSLIYLEIKGRRSLVANRFQP